MQPHREQQYADTDSSEQQESGLIATLLDSAPLLLSRYKTQWAATQDMLSLELKLTLKCVLFILMFLMILGCVLLSIWFGLNVAIAFGMLAIEAPIWSIVLAIVVFHLFAFGGLLRAIKQIAGEMGFKQSLAAFSSTHPAETTKEG